MEVEVGTVFIIWTVMTTRQNIIYIMHQHTNLAYDRGQDVSVTSRGARRRSRSGLHVCSVWDIEVKACSDETVVPGISEGRSSAQNLLPNKQMMRDASKAVLRILIVPSSHLHTR